MMGTKSLCKLGAEDLPPRALVVQDDQGVGRQRLEVAKVQLLSHLFLLDSSCSAFLSFSFPLGNLFFLLRLIEDDLPSLLVVRVRVDISQDFPDRAADALNRASQGKPMEQFSRTKKKADLSPVKFASFFELCIFILMLHIFQNTGPGCKGVGGGNIHIRKKATPVELFEELYSLVPRDVRTKVNVLLQTLVEPINQLNRTDAVLIGAQTLLLLPQRKPTS